MSNQPASIKKKALSNAQSSRVALWAWVGGIVLLTELYIWFTWISGPHFTPTDPGPDTITQSALWLIYAIQGLSVSLAVLGVWFWILKPWIKEKQLTTDGMLAICCWMFFIYDCSMNYTVVTVLYNAYAVNMGAWTLGSWPGWTSPNGNQLPEPLLVAGTGYLCFIFFMVVFPCWVTQKVKVRYPNMGVFSTACMLILGVMITDAIIEILVLRTGVYAYPGGIREFTLFAGETYQFPLTEAITFGGGVSFVALLRFFKDDRGQTFVEKGLDKIRLNSPAKQWVKFLALFGSTHLAFIFIFTIPNQWLGTHSDPFPEGYPSYMTNGLCAYGDDGNQCPGPGISMPRPENNPW